MDAFGFDTCREQHISLSYEFLRTRAVYYSGGIHSGVVQLDVVDSGLAEKFVPVIHLYAEGAQNLLRVLRILDDGTVGLILFRARIRQYCEVVLKKLGIRRELHHLRINEDKLQL